MDILLTSTKFIRTVTNISDNVTDKYLLPALRESQEINLQEILGTELLNKVKELIATGKIEDDTNKDYKELVDNCSYFLAYATIANLCIITSFKIDNIGVNVTGDDNVNNLPMNDVFRLQDYYIHKRDFYALRLQRFIIRNHKKYPEVDKCQLDSIHSNLYATATSNLFLGGRRGIGYNNRCKRLRK